MRTPRLLLGAVIAVTAVAVASFFFLDERAPDADITRRTDPAPSAPAPTDDAPDAAALTPQLREEAAVAAAAPDPLVPPESYRKALGAVVGRIVEPDGTPVPEMAVDLLGGGIPDLMPPLETWFAAEPPDFDPLKATTVTDADGRFRFDDLEMKTIHVLGVDLEGPRAKLELVDRMPNPGETVDLGDVRLDPYVVYLGRVVDPRGAPVGAARVRATNLPSLIFSFGAQSIGPGFAVAFQQPPSDEWRVLQWPWLSRMIARFPAPTTYTAADGTFRLEGVPLGQVTVVVDKEHFEPLVVGPMPAGAGAPERDLGDLRMRAGEILEGRVLDAAGKPLAGAEVFAGPQFDVLPAGVLMPVATSREDGTFAADGLTDADHVVAARHPNGAEWSVVTDIVPGIDEPELRFGATESLRVIARGADGMPIPRPALVIQPVSDVPLHPLLTPPIPLGKRTTYLADGAVSVAGLPPARYSVLVKAEGYAAGKDSVDLTRGAGLVDLALEPEFAAHVVVRAAEGGAPVAWAAAGAFDVKAAQRELRRVPVCVRRTGDQGEVELPGLKAGEYRIRVSHPAFANADVDVKVPGETAIVELREGGALRGRVHMGGAPPDKARFIGLGRGRGDDIPSFSVTDPDGSFEITHLEPGTYEAVILRRFADQPMGEFMQGMGSMMPERFIQVVIEEGKTTTLDVDLLNDGTDGPTGNLRGRVLLDGAPGSGLTISAIPAGNWRNMRSATTDGSGNFDFGKVSAGDVVVAVRRRGARMFMTGELARESTVVRENDVTELAFDIKTGSLRGRVLAASNGSPVVAAQVQLSAAEPAAAAAASGAGGAGGGGRNRGAAFGGRLGTVTERDGTFVVESVPAGTYTVYVRRDGFADAVVSDVVVPWNGEPPPLEVRLATGVEVAGRVELPAGTAQPNGMWLEFRNADDSSRRGGGRVDTTSMEYRVDNLWPGRYEVRFYLRDVRLEPVTVDVPVSGSKGLVLRPLLQKE